jgi:F-type H+-transporting ATPase subunit b
MADLITTFGLNWKIMIIQIVNFGILLFVLKRFVYGPVMDMLEKRKTMIAKGVADAEEAAKKNAEADAEGRRVIAGATREADNIITNSKVRAEEVGATIARSVEQKAQAALKDAEMRAAEIKERALQESKAEIAQAAVLVAEKLLRGEGKKSSNS